MMNELMPISGVGAVATRSKSLTDQKKEALYIDGLVESFSEFSKAAKSTVAKKKMTLSEARKLPKYDLNKIKDTHEKEIASIKNAQRDSIVMEAFQKETSMTLADPAAAKPNIGATSLGVVSTAISSIIAQNPMNVMDTNPLTSNIASVYEDSVETYFPYRFAMAGLASGTLKNAQPAQIQVPSRGYTTQTTGFFGVRSTLDFNQLLYQRATSSIDGFYAAEAMARAWGNCTLQMNQLFRYLITRTITNNEFTYYTDRSNADASTVVQWGRLIGNTIEAASPWATATVAPTSPVYKYTPQANSNPIGWLTQIFSTDAIPVINQTRNNLIGLAMNAQTAGILTQVIQQQTSTSQSQAISLYQAYGQHGWDAGNIIRLNCPPLSDIDIYVVKDVVLNSVNPVFGYVDSNSYYIPDGIIIPIFNYQDKMANGIMLYNPDIRAMGLNGTAPLPSNTFGNNVPPQSGYVKVTDSRMIPGAEDPFWSLEMGVRMSFINPVAPGTSYILKAFDAVA